MKGPSFFQKLFATDRFGPSFQRFLHNSAALGFGQVVNVATQIFYIPAFLHFWSKTEYGEWLVITAIPSLLWTLDNSLSGLAASRMTVASGSGDWARANLIFHNVLCVQGTLSIIILALTGYFVATGNISSAFGFTLMTRTQSGEVLFLMILYMLLGYSLGLMRAAYRACKMEARGIAILNFRALTDFLATIIVLTLHGHAVALACGWLASMFFWVAYCYIDVRRRCPEITFAFGPVSRDQFVSMMVDGLPVLAGTAAGAFFLQGYPLIVNRLLGPATVVTLTAIRTASRTLLQVTGLVCTASSSELSRTYGSRDWDGYLRLLKVLVAVTLWTSVAAVLGLSLAGPWVIEKWTWGKVIVDHQIMLLFVLSVVCQSCWNACGSILFSTNMHHAFNYAYLFLTLAGLGAANIAMHYFGFLGVPMTMLAVDAILLVWAFYLCQKKLVFVPLRSLVCVLYPSFYMDKAQRLLRHISGKADPT